VDLSDIPVPDSPAAATAAQVSAAYSSPALLNHCWRSYLWSAAFGLAHGVGFDAELLYLASMLHDLGLVKEFDSHTVPFEEAGGHLAWVFAAGAGWPAPRRVRVAQVVVRHMWDRVDPQVDPEGFLLGLGTGLDISGRAPQRWPEPLRAQVLDRYPRLDLAGEFISCLQDQARRKPDSLAAEAVASGIAGRMASNVLEGS